MIDRIIEFSARHKYSMMAAVAILMGASYWAIRNIPVDALPDLSDTQVIVYAKWNQSPGIIEDQVTYPIVSAMLGAPKVKTIRGVSDYGNSFIYVIFEDGTDLYWARSRVLEYLSQVQPNLPDGVSVELGPDASALGWVYQYALTDETGNSSLADLRSYQDWNLKYQIQAVDGVSEVASVGGVEKQYQVMIDPTKLQSLDISLDRVVQAIRESNMESGGRIMEFAGREYMVRGRGYIRDLRDLESIVLKIDPATGDPVLLRNVAHIQFGPNIRRGVADLDGKGDTVGAIVVMRDGENALDVIDRVKERIDSLKDSLPEGMKIVTTYDRSELINQAISTITGTLIEEMIIVSVVIIIFLLHIPSASSAAITIPISVFLSFLPLYFTGVTTNLMSLGGIAISIGVLVDGAIIQVENIYTRIQQWQEEGNGGADDGRDSEEIKQDFLRVRIEALKEVGPSIFFSLLVIAVSFMPIFALVGQEGRLFKPLAYSKNLAMAIAAILAITLNPAVQMMFTRFQSFDFQPAWLAKIASALFVGKYHKEEDHPISRFLFSIYEPACLFVLKFKKQVLITCGALLVGTVPLFVSLGSEFMPPLNEGTILYMPTTIPGLSASEAQRMLQVQNRVLKKFPEVQRVFGKAGRAETSTDPAPLSMVETTVILKPESEWRKKERWYSWLPDFMHGLFSWIWSDRISYEELTQEMNKAMQFPGWTNAWTMPIRGRIDMLTTGIRTPIGVKFFGKDLKEIEKLTVRTEQILQKLEGSRSVYAERVRGGTYIDLIPHRGLMSRYGLTVGDLHKAIRIGVGGQDVSTTVEGRERYSIQVRYQRKSRDSIRDLERTLVTTPTGAQIPISQVAHVEIVSGPGMIRNEDGLLSGYVFVDIQDVDIGTYVMRAKQALQANLDLPPGYSYRFSGQYENMQRATDRMMIVIPITLVIILTLMYMNTRHWFKTAIIMMGLPFSIMGAVWLLYALDYNMSIAVWVGMIALMGLDAETGAFMLLFLDTSVADRQKKGLMRNRSDLMEAILHGAVRRVRPKIMTVGTGFVALLPILWSDGTGSDLMRRIAAPMIGGLITSFALELLVYPVLYSIWKEKTLIQSGEIEP
ncbi:MAG: CusA/CzcA family heavy metal efflux RND transporter [Spirochaetaceae bacterium]|nr:CusA/CzcA family heavy metal efflux RND transporter [Spirochaetaceae bacterium]|tara:strand:- start:14588 stop:17884 length:3297 start_codon:yes stop_codon:yes gene_type:complete